MYILLGQYAPVTIETLFSFLLSSFSTTIPTVCILLKRKNAVFYYSERTFLCSNFIWLRKQLQWLLLFYASNSVTVVYIFFSSFRNSESGEEQPPTPSHPHPPAIECLQCGRMAKGWRQGLCALRRRPPAFRRQSTNRPITARRHGRTNGAMNIHEKRSSSASPRRA